MDGVPGLRALPPSAERGPTPVSDREPRPPRDGARRDRDARDPDQEHDATTDRHPAAQVELTSVAIRNDTSAADERSADEDAEPPPVGRRIDLRA